MWWTSPRALFVDQRWIDLAPGLFGDSYLIRHPGYNVAYWNLGHRHVTHAPSGWRVNGQELAFFHYSGLDPHDPRPVSRHQDRFTLSDLGEAGALLQAYCARVLEQGEEACRHFAYAFGRLDDGTPIPDAVRSLYRTDPSVERDGGTTPSRWATPTSASHAGAA